MTLKVKVNDPHFQYQLRVFQNACLVKIWWFEPKFMISYRMDKPNFLEFRVKMAKMTLKVMVNDLYFQYQLRVSQDACWVQICDSSPNLWGVIAQTSRISYNSESKWPKWPSRSRFMTPIFNTNREHPMMHVWCKFGDSSSNLWWVILRTR